MSDKIKAALAQLDVKNVNHWTQAGKPRVETVRMLAGDSTITSEQIEAAQPGFNKTSAEAAAQGNGAGTAGVGTVGNIGAELTPGAGGQQADAAAVQSAAVQNTPTNATEQGAATTPAPSAENVATAARNVVVTATAVATPGTALPASAAVSSAAQKSALDIAAELAGEEVGGGYFTGMGEQKKVLANVGEDGSSNLDAAIESAQEDVQRALQARDQAQEDLDYAQRVYDRLVDSRDQSDVQGDAMQQYKANVNAQTEQRIAAVRRKEAQDAGVDTGPSPLDQAIGQRNRQAVKGLRSPT